MSWRNFEVFRLFHWVLFFFNFACIRQLELKLLLELQTFPHSPHYARIVTVSGVVQMGQIWSRSSSLSHPSTSGQALSSPSPLVTERTCLCHASLRVLKESPWSYHHETDCDQNTTCIVRTWPRPGLGILKVSPAGPCRPWPELWSLLVFVTPPLAVISIQHQGQAGPSSEFVLFTRIHFITPFLVWRGKIGSYLLRQRWSSVVT